MTTRIQHRYTLWQTPTALDVGTLPLESVTSVPGWRMTSDGRLLEPAPSSTPGFQFLQISQQGSVGELLESWEHDAKVRQHLIAACLHVLKRTAACGVALALQGPFPSYRDSFAALVEELTWHLHRAAYQVAVIAPPQLKPHQLDELPLDYEHNAEAWLQAVADSYDYAMLGVYVDWFVLQAWELHRAPSLQLQTDADSPQVVARKPGVIAPRSWLETLLEHAMANLPPRRLVLSLPLYGRCWSVDGIASEPMAHDWQPSSPVDEQVLADGERLLTFDPPTPWQYAYIETVDSFIRKATLVREHDLGGLSVWTATMADAQLTAALKVAFSMDD